MNRILKGLLSRKVYLTLGFLFVCAVLKAQVPARLTIFTEHGEKFNIWVNGDKINKVPAKTITIQDITEPQKIKILFLLPKVLPLQKTLVLEGGTENSYALRKNGKVYKLVLVKNSPLPVKQTAKVPSDTKPKIDSSQSPVNIVVNPEVEPVHIPGYVGNIGCPKPLTPKEYQKVKKTIMAKLSDQDRFKIARQQLNTGCLLTGQVKELVMLFSSEKVRVEMAKFCYGHTYDIGNFSKVNEAFVFETSADELNSYVSEMTH